MQSPEAEQTPPALPSQTFRTVVSLLLFVHLFALGVAMLSNPRDGMASRLLYRLGQVRLLSSYLEVLWMDMSYDYFHTYGPLEFVAPLGTDHLAEIELKYADGRSETLNSPADGLFPPQRKRRYMNLWNNAARTVGQQAAESLLPATIAKSLLTQTGAQSATIKIKRHNPQGMDQARSTDVKARNPMDPSYYQLLYTGYGQLKNGQFAFQKVEDAGGSAPATGSAAPATASPAGAPAAAAPPPSTTPRSGNAPNIPLPPTRPQSK